MTLPGREPTTYVWEADTLTTKPTRHGPHTQNNHNITNIINTLIGHRGRNNQVSGKHSLQIPHKDVGENLFIIL